MRLTVETYGSYVIAHSETLQSTDFTVTGQDGRVFVGWVKPQVKKLLIPTLGPKYVGFGWAF